MALCLGVMRLDGLKQLIRNSFSDVERPPPWCLSNGVEGDECEALRRDFEDVPAWDSLTPEFLDKTPNGLGSALSIFSDEAFRYYLPAFVIADLDGCLQRSDPVFHLTHGLDQSKDVKINTRRYGERTFGDLAHYRFSVFDRKQATAILEYLLYRAALDEPDVPSIRLAIDTYWADRASERG